MSHDGELGDVEFHKQNINPLLTREEDGLHHSNMRSRRPQHSQNIAEIWPPTVGHLRTIGGVKEEFVRVDNYGTFEYDGLTFGEELVYIDTQNDKVIIHDKGWGMDPFDQLGKQPTLCTINFTTYLPEFVYALQNEIFNLL